MKHTFKAILFIAFSVLCTLNFNTYAQTKYYKYVDPFIGSVGAGNVVVGPSCPFGMVKPGPDCDKNSNSGYMPDLTFPVFGFSQVHVSGTGGGAKYGNISVMPFVGDLNEINKTSLRQNENAALGYYSVLLKKWNIKTEITASNRVAYYKFNYNNSINKAVKLDAGEFLNEGFNLDQTEAQFFIGSQIQIVSDNEVCGYNRVRGGWNAGGPYTVFFYAVFVQPFTQFKTWKADKLFIGEKIQVDTGEKTGVLLSFNDNNNLPIQMKIGISFISSAKAKQNTETEIQGWSFAEVLNQTQQKWEKLLGSIEVDKNTPDKLKRMFYTGLYHSMLMPVDRTDENPLWKSKYPTYDDYYAIWDTYRSSHPLITLIDPQRQIDIINSLLDIYLHDGYMPDARSGNSNGRTQGGSNADIMIADAFVKGLKGIDYKLALKAMLKNADISPGGNEEKEGRGGLSDYNTLGYVSMKFPRSGTRTVEYSYDDFCIAELAKGLGEDSIFSRFSKQSNNWQNLWRDYTDWGTTGFVMPREENRKWVDTLKCSVTGKNYLRYTPQVVEYGQCLPWWSSFLYEASSWEYSLSVPQNIAGLINRCGGVETFKNRLDTFFDKGLYNVGNEPSFLSPNLYNWIGKPELSSDLIHRIISKSYNDTRDGITGNDDSGAMSSWLAFHFIGIYPVAGQSFYLITTPFFTESILHLKNGNDFKIVAKNLSSKNKYIKSAKLNNQTYTKDWIENSSIETGGTLVLEMSDKPYGWGNNDLPPSNKFN